MNLDESQVSQRDADAVGAELFVAGLEVVPAVNAGFVDQTATSRFTPLKTIETQKTQKQSCKIGNNNLAIALTPA